MSTPRLKLVLRTKPRPAPPVLVEPEAEVEQEQQEQAQTPLYHGETTCVAIVKSTKKPCTKKAYYVGPDAHSGFCGTHASSKTELPKNPMAGTIKRDQLLGSAAAAERAARDNKAAGRSGELILSKMRMMHNPDDHEGFLKVFPNFKHGNRKDGLGLPSLSPKSIGPVRHNQAGLPPALNLENLHQGNKCFHDELDEKGQPLPIFYERQRLMYTDRIPWRHKFEKFKELKAPTGNRNIPAYAVWLEGGEELHLSYFESRQIYCNLYERAVRDNPDFHRLRARLADGYNLQICGYDAYPVDRTQPDWAERAYLDTNRPFGHELVLYCMLLGERPWAAYTTLDL